MEENVLQFRPRHAMARSAAARLDEEPPDGLIAACRDGDRVAFTALFELYGSAVYCLAVHFTGDPALAADVTQDVFLKLLTRLGTFRQEARFTTWLYRVVANVVWDHRRKGRATVPLDDAGLDLMPAAGRSPEDDAVRRQASHRVARAVRRLAPRLRLPLLMRHVAQLSYEEIALALDVSVGTVASRLNRAHRRLARELREEVEC
jgi:RNA polymerase sigma-70 factor (ECF subfamily)